MNGSGQQRNIPESYSRDLNLTFTRLVPLMELLFDGVEASVRVDEVVDELPRGLVLKLRL